jgi:hypothetical protein
MTFSPNIFGLNSNDVLVELKFFQQTYHLNEPINVIININNNSQSPVSFSVSPQIYESLFFVLRTPQNEELQVIDSFQAEMRDNAASSGDYREIVLLPNESFSRVIDITKWFDIRESGYYYIKGIFYPNPDLKNESIESFNYKILIKPPALIENNLTMEQQQKADEIEKSRSLPPYDVINDLLDAKMKKDWDRFLVHIDAERLIASFDDFNNAYENARTGRYKLEVLDDFKRYLTVYWQDRILSYKVTESNIKEDNATVTCEVDYQINRLNYSFRYIFYLYKDHLTHWLVYDYTAFKIK